VRVTSVTLRWFVSVVVVSALSGCGDSQGSRERGSPAPETVRNYSRSPLYWAGPHFERWALSSVSGPSRPDHMFSFIYGTCTPTDGDEPSCLPPIDLQVSAPCWNLDLVARDRIWRKRRVRGAPVGQADNAPLLFSKEAQVKVYTATNDSHLGLRVLGALRSANDVQPILDPDEPIPALPDAVLAGTAKCPYRR
jgi:hypothetical protein